MVLTHKHLVVEPSPCFILGIGCGFSLFLTFYLWVRLLTEFLINISMYKWLLELIGSFPQFECVANPKGAYGSRIT